VAPFVARSPSLLPDDPPVRITQLQQRVEALEETVRSLRVIGAVLSGDCFILARNHENLCGAYLRQSR